MAVKACSGHTSSSLVRSYGQLFQFLGLVHKWHFVYHRPAASMYEIKSIQLPIYCKCDVCCAICFVKKIYCGLPLRSPQLRNVASTAAYLFIINSLSVI
jgi:hypothetical protein